MKKICCVLIMLCGLCSAPSFSDEIRLSIGINLNEYPELEVIPGYPVYYAPQLNANYFFYDGDYWLYQDDNWFESDWYDGPWRIVEPEDVPVFILRIPVRFYRLPPVYFFSWESDEPPHWGEHWGHDWEEHRRGWDRWDHRIHIKPAPLPLYQRKYVGEHYPRQFEQQNDLQQQHYRYRSRDPLVQQRHRQQSQQSSPVVRRNRNVPPENGGAMRREGSAPSPSMQQQGGVMKDHIENQGGAMMQGGQGDRERRQDGGDRRDSGRGQERDRDR